MNVGKVKSPVLNALLNENLDKTNTLFSNNYLDVKLPLEGLTFRLNTGYTQRNGKTFNYTPTFNRAEFFNLGSGKQAYTESRNLTVEHILRYDRPFAEDHAFNLTLLYGAYQRSEDHTSKLQSLM